MAVTKERIIDAVFETAELSRKVARDAVENLMTIIKKTLVGEEDVMVTPFNYFQTTPRPWLAAGRLGHAGAAG